MKMKILIAGDWHIRKKKPANRLDRDYFKSISHKLVQEFNAAEKHKVMFIAQPGDIFDTHTVSDNIVRQTIQLLSKCTKPIFAVPGQHDLVYHSKIWQNTPLGILDAPKDGITVLPNDVFDMGEVNIYASGWEQPIPEIQNKKTFNILICHKLIVDTKKWKGNFSYEYDATQLLHNTGYDLIISGDNHETFTVTLKDQTLINAGSLIRTRIDQVDHKPCYFIFDTGTRKFEQHFLKVADVHDILNIVKAKKEKEDNLHLVEFTDRIQQQEIDDEELNIRKRLVKRIRENRSELGSGVVSILKEVMREDDRRTRDQA